MGFFGFIELNGKLAKALGFVIVIESLLVMICLYGNFLDRENLIIDQKWIMVWIVGVLIVLDNIYLFYQTRSFMKFLKSFGDNLINESH